MLTIAHFYPNLPMVNFSMGSIMQGLLMETLPENIANHLHQTGLRPYSQALYWDSINKRSVWRIATLTQTAKNFLILPLLNNCPEQNFHLKNKNITFKITSGEIIRETSYHDLTAQHFCSPAISRHREITFFTPTSFKSAGNYMIYPYTEHILKSLLQRWQTFATEISLADDNTFIHLLEHININKYNLFMTNFFLENTKIPSFRGSLNFYIKGPESLVRIANLLLDYANFSGLGIKTALGMGMVVTK